MPFAHLVGLLEAASKMKELKELTLGPKMQLSETGAATLKSSCPKLLKLNVPQPKKE